MDCIRLHVTVACVNVAAENHHTACCIRVSRAVCLQDNSHLLYIPRIGYSYCVTLSGTVALAVACNVHQQGWMSAQ